MAVTKCDWTVVVIVAAEEYERMRRLNRSKKHLGLDAKKQVKESAENSSFVDSSVEGAMIDLRSGT